MSGASVVSKFLGSRNIRALMCGPMRWRDVYLEVLAKVLELKVMVVWLKWWGVTASFMPWQTRRRDERVEVGRWERRVVRVVALSQNEMKAGDEQRMRVHVDRVLLNAVCGRVNDGFWGQDDIRTLIAGIYFSK